jgi:hypothetical protein
MPQPPSIKKFDIFYLAALGVYAVGFFLGFDQTVGMIREQYAAAGMTNLPVEGITTGGFIFGIAISLLLWWFVSAKRSTVAKWILIVFFALGLLGLPTIFQNLNLTTGISLLSMVLSAVAIWFLFQPDTKPWFDKEPRG